MGDRNGHSTNAVRRTEDIEVRRQQEVKGGIKMVRLGRNALVPPSSLCAQDRDFPTRSPPDSLLNLSIVKQKSSLLNCAPTSSTTTIPPVSYTNLCSFIA